MNNQFVVGFALGVGLTFGGLLIKDYMMWNKGQEDKPNYWDTRKGKTKGGNLPEGVNGMTVIV